MALTWEAKLWKDTRDWQGKGRVKCWIQHWPPPGEVIKKKNNKKQKKNRSKRKPTNAEQNPAYNTLAENGEQ